MRVYLKCVDLDNITYNVNNFQDKANDDIINIFGSVNKERTRYTFNLNLYSILGDKVNKQKTFNIRLNNIICINEQGQNIIDYSSPSVLRTCNVVICGGLNFCNSKTENVLTQFTNYDKNREISISNIYLFRGSLTSYRIQFRNDIYLGAELQKYLLEGNGLAVTTLTDGNPITNKLNTYGRFIGRASNSNNTYFNNRPPMYIFNLSAGGLPNLPEFNWYDPTLTIPSIIPFDATGFGNQTFDFETIPTSNEWFNNDKFDVNINEDVNNNELTCYMQNGNEISVTIELRDLLNNRLIIPSDYGENNKVYPCIEYIFEIY